jgi:HK97 family phage major capsid protein
MDFESLSDKTTADLTRIKANDFVRLVTLQARFADDPNQHHLALRNFSTFFPKSLNAHLFEKSAVAAATTLDATWASPLSPIRPFADAFVALLRPRTIVGRIPNLREVPANVSVSAQTTGGVYAWVGQGAPVPVTKSDYTTVTLPASKVGGIIAVSEELAELGTPSAINTLREEMIAGCAQFIDQQFVDPAKAVVTDVSPASITNGASTTASAGTNQANANTDMQVLISNFYASNPDAENAVILMSAPNAVAIARATNQPTLGARGGSIWGIPVIVSASVGARLIAFDANQVLLADDGGLSVDVSKSALVQMDSSPADPTVSGTVLISLFQKNLVGLKITRMIAWKRVATSAVYYISAAAYV